MVSVAPDTLWDSKAACPPGNARERTDPQLHACSQVVFRLVQLQGITSPSGTINKYNTREDLKAGQIDRYNAGDSETNDVAGHQARLGSMIRDGLVVA